MLLHRNENSCPARGFYTYNAFIAAANSFGGFGTTGDTDTRKREIAAFLSQTSHETTGGWATAPDGPYSWGYCFKEEQGNLPNYCSPSAQWPCAPGKKYYGRGPIQLAYNHNYGPAGSAIGANLLGNPDLVATDANISFKTAVWFWMTPQAPKPSSHDVITSRWTPSAADSAANRVPGYGVITNIMNGGVECGHGDDATVNDRIGFYKRYCQILGVSPGGNLDCGDQRLFNSQMGAQPFDFPSANISTKWLNNPSIYYIQSILVRETSGPTFYCGFISSGSSTMSFLFSIFISPHAIDDITYSNPQIVWSANRERLVGVNATLEFSKNGNLILRDFDGTQVWSTNTSGKAVVKMYVNEVGSLVLSDNKNNTVWSSIDFPTDCLVLGQTLRQGQRLTANVSVTNSSQGSVYLSIVRGGFQAFVGSNPPQLYYYKNFPVEQEKTTYVSFNNGSLDVFTGSSTPNPIISIQLPLANSVQYMRLDYGGHLRIYEWKSTGWAVVSDVLYPYLGDDCAYPTVCGEYGICSNGQCTCPSSVLNDSLNYFRPVDQWNPNAGCMPSTPISCKSIKTQEFLLLQNVSYFNYIDYKAAYMNNTNAEACKQACLVSCSCKAALFQYGQNASSGNCFLPSELYSLTYNNIYYVGYDSDYYYSSAFIKVQSFPIKGKKVSSGVIIGASVGSLLAFFLVIVCIIALIWRRNRYREVDDDDEFNMLPGLPTRFTFEDLRVATNDFLRKLGEGGFGSVFKGTLIDDTKIAVKRLDGVGQGKKEFLAEVETIGSIHHIHLVKLIGFCAEKSYRLLIYEYMPNGSLDKWIFYKDHHNIVLDWQTRRKIIIGIARGLAYLHEECRKKIVHLDIKPQNILLNENFDAKVSDFGLAKLIDRDQIEVRTRMRGTPGYLAPEWLTSVITEKVDVFSFGVVVLEIVCGRRNLDYSKDEESLHLIGMLQQKVEENKLVDIIDCRSTDMQLHIEDVTMVMHLAMWCLQSDSNKRPCMSKVLKVLEGSMNVEANLNYNFTNLAPYVSRNVNTVESVLPIASILSGPR